MASYQITLEFPPSNNTYYTVFRGRKILSTEGKQYKVRAKKEIQRQLGRNIKKLTGRLRIWLGYSRYDRRTYDIANFEKAVADTLSGLVYIDDSQIDLHIQERLPVSESGYCLVVVEQLAKRSLGNPKVEQLPECSIRKGSIYPQQQKRKRNRKPLKKRTRYTLNRNKKTSSSIEERINRSGKRK